MTEINYSEIKQISILGCGWLGLPLASYLISKGFEINGSTTSENKIIELENIGIKPFLIDLQSEKVDGNILGFLEKSSVLIINIPPKLRKENSDNFVLKINYLITLIEKSTIEKVVFISSTSVYDDDNQIVTESSITNPESESGKQLLEVEQLLQKNKNFETTIIRFGGLIGDNRHPIFMLAGKKDIQNPDAPINLIHLNDCVEIIFDVIKNETWNETINAVSDFHPTRKDYYTQKAIELNLEIPEFNLSNISKGKLVLSEKLKRKFHNL